MPKKPSVPASLRTMESEIKRMRQEYELLQLAKPAKKVPNGLITLSVLKDGKAIHSFPDLTPKEFVKQRREFWRVLNGKLKLNVKFKRVPQYDRAG